MDTITRGDGHLFSSVPFLIIALLPLPPHWCWCCNAISQKRIPHQGQLDWRIQGQWDCYRDTAEGIICLRFLSNYRGVGEEGAAAQLAVCIQGEEGDKRATAIVEPDE